MTYDASKDIEDTMVRAMKWAMNDGERSAEVLERTCLSVAVVIAMTARGNVKAASELIDGAEGYIQGEVARILHSMRP